MQIIAMYMPFTKNKYGALLKYMAGVNQTVLRKTCSSAILFTINIKQNLL
jgi:hypothetical protein